MTPPSEPNALASLLAEMGWLRRLARELVHDPHRADDAVQETYAAAVERPPDASRPLRAWLAVVLRNKLRAEHREGSRRTMRERVTARAEELPSAAELASRVELQKQLAEAVLALSEPVRSTVVLRFFEDLPPRRIAARQGVPVATVKSRLARGLSELRARLDRGHGGDGRAWALALTPLLRPPLEPAPLLPFAIGALAVNVKLLLSILALAAVLVLAFLHTTDESPTKIASTIAAEPPRPVRAPAGNAVESTPPANAGVRSPLAPESTAEVDVAETPPVAALVGFVFDAAGAPLAGVGVASDAPRVATRSDEQGRFRYELPRPGGWIAIDEPGYVTVLRGSTAVASRASVVVGARPIDLAGTVVDTAGAPLGGARVELELPYAFRGRFPAVADDSQERGRGTETDEHGRFDLAGFPAIEGATLRVSKRGYRPGIAPVPAASDAQLVLTLEPPESAPTAVRGKVIDGTGMPAEGAIVGWGRRSVETAADGTFAFPVTEEGAVASEADVGAVRPAHASSPEEEALLTMVAVRRGALPGRVRATSVDGRGRALWPEPLVIELGGAPLAIRGRVEDSDGKPLADVRVWANALSLFGWLHDSTSGESELIYLENEVGGHAPGWNHVRSDARGEFVIEGLLPRNYHVTALDARTVARVDLADVPSGSSGVVLRFEREGLIPLVRGRVLDQAGRGIARVRVRVTTDAYTQGYHGQTTGAWHESGSTTETNAEGRFELTQVPRERAYLRFDGEDVLPMSLGQGEPRWPHGDREVVVTLERRCHFHVDLSDPALADEIELLDRDGAAVMLTEFQGGGSFSSNRMRLHAGKSSNLVATDRARALVLYRDDEEVVRVPVELRAGELTTIRP